MEDLINTFSISVENINLTFLLHSESFLQKFQPNSGKSFHNHLYYEVLYSISGNNTLHFTDHKKSFPANSVIIIPPFAQHYAEVSVPNSLFSIGFRFSENKETNYQNDVFLLLNTAIKKDHYSIAVASERLKQFFWQLAKANDDEAEKNILFQSTQSLLLAQIILEICLLKPDIQHFQVLTPMEGKSNAKYRIPPRIPSDLLCQINYALIQEYMTDVTPESLSKILFVTPRQIDRYILNQYGRTFLQQRTVFRISRAKALLSKTNIPAVKIAEMVGYRSVNTFYHAFKTQVGMTPDVFRQTSKQE